MRSQREDFRIGSICLDRLTETYCEPRGFRPRGRPRGHSTKKTWQALRPTARRCFNTETSRRSRRTTLGIRNRLRLFHLFHLSKPASDRPIYQAVYERRAQKILEIGVGTARRALQLIEVARQHHPAEQIGYTGVDPFEARKPEDGPGLTLKEAYRRLRATGVGVRLVPGDPLAVFSVLANQLGIADVVLIAWPMDRQFLPRAAYYLHRVTHAQSLVLWEQSSPTNPEKSVKVLTRERIESLAAGFRRAA